MSVRRKEGKKKKKKEKTYIKERKKVKIFTNKYFVNDKNGKLMNLFDQNLICSANDLIRKTAYFPTLSV